MYDQVISDLRQSYDGMAEERDKKEIASWKIEERYQFYRCFKKRAKRIC